MFDFDEADVERLITPIKEILRDAENSLATAVLMAAMWDRVGKAEFGGMRDGLVALACHFLICNLAEENEVDEMAQIDATVERLRDLAQMGRRTN